MQTAISKYLCSKVSFFLFCMFPKHWKSTKKINYLCVGNTGKKKLSCYTHQNYRHIDNLMLLECNFEIQSWSYIYFLSLLFGKKNSCNVIADNYSPLSSIIITPAIISSIRVFTLTKSNSGAFRECIAIHSSYSFIRDHSLPEDNTNILAVTTKRDVAFPAARINQSHNMLNWKSLSDWIVLFKLQSIKQNYHVSKKLFAHVTMTW